MFVKGSSEAAELYKRAFNAELMCVYPNDNGGYMYAELNAYGQKLAVSEIAADVAVGNTSLNRRIKNGN
jgi:PhnB protein